MNHDDESCPLGGDSSTEGITVNADPGLLAQGWVRRNLEEPTRAKELVELYESLGFEVRVEKLSPESFPDQCQVCGLSVCSAYVMIYTRKPYKATS